MIILGTSCYYHYPAAVALKDGEVVVAQEKRVPRKKQNPYFPNSAIEYFSK